MHSFSANCHTFYSFQCSFKPLLCSEVGAINSEYAVRNYHRTWGTKGLRYQCLFNPKNRTQVIRHRIYPKTFNSIFLPSVCLPGISFMISISFLIYVMVKTA